MISIQERTFHLVMGAVFLGSTFLDEVLRSAVSAWNPPEASLITTVIGLAWVGRYAWWKQERVEERERVLADQIERLERRAGALEDELREHLRRPL